jgi:hypothetical protein
MAPRKRSRQEPSSPTADAPTTSNRNDETHAVQLARHLAELHKRRRFTDLLKVLIGRAFFFTLCMVGKEKGAKSVKGKKALEKEWQDALAAAETGDPLIASAKNTTEKASSNGGRMSDEEYKAHIEAMRAGSKKKSK